MHRRDDAAMTLESPMSDAAVVGTVHVHAAPGKGDEVLEAFRACQVKTHEEAGNLSYALHRDNADHDHIVLVERWASQQALDEHMGTPHVADLLAVAGTEGMLASAPELTFSSPLPSGDPAKGTI